MNALKSFVFSCSSQNWRRWVDTKMKPQRLGFIQFAMNQGLFFTLFFLLSGLNYWNFEPFCWFFRYMIVRNVPALGCGDDLMRLFMTYGEVEEWVSFLFPALFLWTMILFICLFGFDSCRCKPMDAEDCAEFTDVYWIKFRLITNARFWFFFLWWSTWHHWDSYLVFYWFQTQAIIK